MSTWAEREMEAALIADGEKLRALTGEGHGPWTKEECPKCGATSGDSWHQCFGHEPCPMGGPSSGMEIDDHNPAAEVAELREQLATARAALKRLSTFEAMTIRGWGFSHPEITARVEFARSAFGDRP